MRTHERTAIGHTAIVQIPLHRRALHTITSQYAPGAQQAGNLLVLDVQEVSLLDYVDGGSGIPYWQARIVHVNPRGTDASDLADFAEQAAGRLGISLPEGYQPIVDGTVKPIAFKRRPHEGTPRAPTSRRRKNGARARTA